MVFSSLTFLLFFLPLVLLGHTALPRRFRNAFLLAASLVFYAAGDLGNLPLLAAMTLADWAAAKWMDRTGGNTRRALLAVSVGLNAGILIVFKYLKLIAPGLRAYPALPLGISFFAFQSISYLVDVYRREVEAERNLKDYAAYILLFPQLIAGPIVRYSQVRKELHDREVTAEHLEKGMMLFLCGLALKTLLANPLGEMCEGLRAIPERGAAAGWMALLSCAFQYYYDFFGYSLMALGMGRMMGFRFPDNFRHPFAAVSIQDLWRRWHMTLGAFLRSYVYIPLGGSRKGKLRMIFSLLVTWAVSGLWHGAGWNFLWWGLYFGVLIVMERCCWGGWLSRHPAAGRIYTLILFVFSWTLFINETPGDILSFTGELFRLRLGENAAFLTMNGALALAGAVLLAFPGVWERMAGFVQRHPAAGRAGAVLLLAMCLMALTRAGYNPFLYFRF